MTLWGAIALYLTPSALVLGLGCLLYALRTYDERAAEGVLAGVELRWRVIRTPRKGPLVLAGAF